MADLKASHCGEATVSDDVSPKAEEILSLLERRGIVEDQSIASKKARAADQKMRRKMYHNTQLMLKHYRDIVWALECFPAQVAAGPDQRRTYSPSAEAGEWGGDVQYHFSNLPHAGKADPCRDLVPPGYFGPTLLPAPAAGHEHPGHPSLDGSSRVP